MKNFDADLQAKKTALVGENLKLAAKFKQLLMFKHYGEISDIVVKMSENNKELELIDKQLKQQQ
jgi:hypothetical protein